MLRATFTAMLVIGAAAVAQAAPFVDSLDTAGNIGCTDAGMNLAVASGELTATRIPAGSSWGGFWWNQTGSDGWGTASGAFSLNPADQQNVLVLDIPREVNAGFWSVWIHLYDDAGNHVLGEQAVQMDTNQTGTFQFDISAAVANWTATIDPGYSAATQWRPVINLIGNQGDGMVFNTLAAVPEPGVSVLIGAGALALAARRRR